MTSKTAPPALLEKLNPDGTYQPYAGNTIICHIDPESAAFAALTDVHAQLSQRSFSQKLSLLPTSSYHMTLFGGANDKHRRPGNWPESVAFDTPIADCHKELARRLEGFDLECDLPFRMKVSSEDVREKEMALRLELEPVDEAENQKLRRLRDRLSILLGIKAPGHETYGFHISLAYVIDWFAPDELKDYRQSYAKWRDMVALHSPVIELGRPEFCTFKNMLRFDRQFYLGA